MMFRWRVQYGQTTAVHGAGGVRVGQRRQKRGWGVKGPPGQAREHRPLAAVRVERRQYVREAKWAEWQALSSISDFKSGFWVKYGGATKDYEF